MLDKTVEIIDTYDDWTLARLEMVFVDDGSMKYSLLCPKLKCRSKSFRILEGIGINNGGAKNLGAAKASGEWCALLDLDHWFNRDLARALIETCEREERDIWFMFDRRINGVEIIKRAINCKVFRRPTFMAAPYVEDFIGYYGCEDKLHARLFTRHKGSAVFVPKIVLDLTTMGTDANTNAITDRRLLGNRIMLKLKYAHLIPFSRRILRLPYEELVEPSSP
jgi:hypothetical protein